MKAAQRLCFSSWGLAETASYCPKSGHIRHVCRCNPVVKPSPPSALILSFHAMYKPDYPPHRPRQWTSSAPCAHWSLCGDPHCATLWRGCPRQRTPRRTRWLTALRLPAPRLSGVVGLQPTRGSACGGLASQGSR